MPDRALQPLSGGIPASVDLDHRRQAVEKQPCGVALASEIAADDPSRLASAADPKGAEIAGEEAADCGPAVDQLRRSSIGDRVRVPVRNDGDVAGRQGNLRLAPHPDKRPSLGDQMVADKPLGAG
jgi:hypothetical protein